MLAGEKPAVCDWSGCTFACADFSNLRRHQRTHMPHLRCQYPGCGAQNSTLKDHTKRHNHKREFVCVSEGCSFAGCATPGPALLAEG